MSIKFFCCFFLRFRFETVGRFDVSNNQVLSPLMAGGRMPDSMVLLRGSQMATQG